MGRPFGAATLFLLLIAGGPTRANAQEFDPSFVANSALLPADSMGMIYRAVSSWVSQQTLGVDPSLAPGAREDLYRVIASAIHYATEDTATPYLMGSNAGAEMFDLGTYLGVYGAGLVAAALAASPDLGVGEALLPEPPLSLSYSHPIFRLASEQGWSIQFPYYFMPWAMQEAELTGGTAQFVALSTLHAVNTSQPGTSQSTILIIASRDPLNTGFVEAWRTSFAVPAEASCSSEEWHLPDLVDRWCFTHEGGIPTEFGFVENDEGTVIIVYSGLPGPYEANRDQFLALLRTFTLG